MKNDCNKRKTDVKEDLSTGILARHLPVSMIIERLIKIDAQVESAAKLVENDSKFNSLLAQTSALTNNNN